MNWVLLAVIAILAGYTLTGYAKGFLKIVYSLVSWIVILVFVMVATPYIENYLRNDTNIYHKVVEYCETALQAQAEKAMDKNGGDISALLENELFAQIAEKVPAGLLENLKEQTGEMAEEFVDDLMQEYDLYGSLATSAADLIIKGVATLAAVIGGAVVSAVISIMLGFIGKLPLIGFANRILGLVAGAANGLLIVWIAFYLVSLFGATELGSGILTYINANEFLVYLYENNVVRFILS